MQILVFRFAHSVALPKTRKETTPSLSNAKREDIPNISQPREENNG